jgi:hypothetical protein
MLEVITPAPQAMELTVGSQLIGVKMSEHFFIRVVEGKPFEHPIAEWNLRQFYPDLDVDNPPQGFEKFIRVPLPIYDQSKTHDSTHYEKIDNIWRDVHIIRDLTPSEKAEKIRISKEIFPFKDTWTLDEAKIEWIPPFPYPDDGKKYFWDNNNIKWITEEEFQKLLELAKQSSQEQSAK